MTPLPFVSVIVPSFNSYESLLSLFERLGEQTYPKERFEVILVDNCSTDRTKEFSESGRCIYVFEGRKKNSYAARNRGVLEANGSILAFIDADCMPCESWLEEGVLCMLRSEAGIVAGGVIFTSDRQTISGIYDSCVNIQVKRAVRDRGLAMTANLFVGRSVIDRMGCFDENARSGSDLVYTAMAHDQGLGLVFCGEAKVEHPCRNFNALVAKAKRTSLGKRYWTKERLIGLGLTPKRLENKMSRRLLSPLVFGRVVKGEYPNLSLYQVGVAYGIHVLLIAVSLVFKFSGRGLS